MGSELLLNANMEKNYHALQRFLNNDPDTGRKRGKGSGANGKLLRIKVQNYRCLDCNGKFLPDPNKTGSYSGATMDHIIPYRFGSCLEYNSEVVCHPCNQAREFNRMFHILRFFGTITEIVNE